MKVRTNLSLVEYVGVVDAIVDGYFDAEGEYQPALGYANTMRVFYNICVEESKFDSEIPHDFVDIIMVDKLAADQEFISNFESANREGCEGFTFSHAVVDAKEVVRTRTRSLSYSITPVIKVISQVLNDAIDKIDGKEFAKAIWDAYGESELLKREPESKDNIVPIKKGDAK